MANRVSSADFFARNPVFTHDEFARSHGSRGKRSPRTVDSLLTQHAASGNILRVRRGLYAAVPAGFTPENLQVDPYLLATKLAPDAAVAYHAALQYRGSVYSIWNRFTVLTRSHLRPFEFRGSSFVAVSPPRGRSSDGIVTEGHAGGSVRVTTFERTLVDVLDDLDLGGGFEEVWRSLEMVDFFDLDAVVRHALEGTSLTAARVGFFLEQHRKELFVEDRHLAALRARAPRQPRYFHAKREPGRLRDPWNLIVPERILQRSWEEPT